MKYTAAFVLSRTTDLVARFRSKPRAASVAFVRSKVKSPPSRDRSSTEILVRQLVQPVMRRQKTPAF